MVEILFQTNHPTASEQKNGRENQLFGLLPEILPSCRFTAKPHLVGNRPTLYPTYCGDKKNFQKSYTNDIPHVKARKTPRLCCKNRNLFAAVNKNQRDFLKRDRANARGSFRDEDLDLRLG